MLQEFTMCHLQNSVSNDLVLPKTFPETLAYNGCLNLLLNEGVYSVDLPIWCAYMTWSFFDYSQRGFFPCLFETAIDKKWLRKVFCGRITTICSYCAKSINIHLLTYVECKTVWIFSFIIGFKFACSCSVPHHREGTMSDSMWMAGFVHPVGA